MQSPLLNQLPKNWYEVTVFQYQELVEIELRKNEMSTTEYFLEKVALFLDTSVDDELFDELDSQELFELINALSWTNSPVPVCNPVEISGMVPKKLDTLCLGEFIDLENLTLETDQNLHKIAAILYKQTRKDSWNNTQVEPYDYDLEERSEIFLDAPLPGIYNMIKNWTSWRNNFLENYEELFQEEPEAELDEDLEPHEIAEQRKQLQREKNAMKWSWENTIWNLCDKDITKMKDVFGLEVIFVFNMLAMRKSLEI